jgi:hypothetical protein
MDYQDIKGRNAYAEHMFDSITSDEKTMRKFIWHRIQDDAARLDIEYIHDYLDANEVVVTDE